MSPIVNPNFDEANLPAGTYRAKIVSCEQKTSKQNKPYLNFKFETIDEMYPGQWVFMGTALAGKGAQVLKTLVQAAFDPNYESGPIDTDHLIGCEVMIKVDKGINQDGSESKYMAVLEIHRAEVAW